MNYYKKLQPKLAPTNGMLSITDLSAASGAKVVTIRYYETMGVLPKPKVPKSGHRFYTADYVEHLRFIEAARFVGMSLAEIKDFLRLARGFKTPAKNLMDRLKEQIATAEIRIKYLQDLRGILREVLSDPMSNF